MRPLLPDVPLPLGEHLDELRRRLIWPIVLWGVVFIAAFGVQDLLKELFVQPLLHAVQLAERFAPGCTVQAGIVIDPAQPLRVLKTLELGESMWVSMSLAMWAAFALVVPFFIQQLYMFVSIGLTARERHLAFLFVPLAAILFYAGAAFGYYLGMPYIFAWFIQFTANDPIGTFDLRLSSYRDSFFLFTLMFGLLFEVPWAVVVACRVGLVTPAQLARWRRFFLLISAVIAALVGPGDPVVMLILMVPTYFLFEIGLIAARFVGGPRQDPAHA